MCVSPASTSGASHLGFPAPMLLPLPMALSPIILDRLKSDTCTDRQSPAGRFAEGMPMLQSEAHQELQAQTRRGGGGWGELGVGGRHCRELRPFCSGGSALHLLVHGVAQEAHKRE